MEFNSVLDGAISKSGAKNAKAVKALLDLESLKISKNQADDITKALDEIKKSFNSEPINADDKESALELLDEINTKISQNKKPSVIKSALIGLKDFALNVGANVTAALIAAKIQGLF